MAAARTFDGYDDLPKPPSLPRSEGEERLELEIILNGLARGIVAHVVRSEGRFRVTARDLRDAGMLLPPDFEGLLYLDSLEGVQVDYDASRQQLHLTVLPHYLPSQHLGPHVRPFEPADQTTGALLNYDLFLSGGGGGPLYASLWHEARLFSKAGVFSSSGAWSSRTGRRGASAYRRYDTYWRLSDQEGMVTFEAGDVITRSLPSVPALRIGGFQIARNFSVRPDVVTYPLPEFSGSAALPSTVELMVNGQRVAGSRVNPGPFALDVLPPINGYDEANLIVTDVHGRSIATSIPFYVSSTLLRAGLTDFSASAGSFRRDYGVRNFSYEGFAASGAIRHGVTDALTLELRGETSGDVSVIGAGGAVRLGNFGALSGSYSQSFAQGAQGAQLSVGYDYQRRGIAFGMRHTRQTNRYFDLADIGYQDRTGRSRETAASLSVSLGTAGTLGVSYFDIQSRVRMEERRATRFANVSWTMPLFANGRLYASVSRDFARSSWNGLLTFSLQIGRGSLNAGVLRSDNGRLGQRIDYSQSVPTDGGIGWNAGLYRDGSRSPDFRGDVVWRTQQVQLRAGAYGQDRANAWLGAAGSLAFVDGYIFAANRIADAFAIVDTNEPNIPVRYENQLIGETNADGRLLIASVNAFYPGLVDIDTLMLPAAYRAPAVSQRIAVAAGSGKAVHFAIERMVQARGRLIDANGAPLPAGAKVLINEVTETFIGWDGLLFVENVRSHNVLKVLIPEGASCSAIFEAPAAPPQDTEIVELGDVSCQH